MHLNITLQMIQNAAARLVFSVPRYSHVTPLLSDLHWLPVIARIKRKRLVLWCLHTRQTLHTYQTSPLRYLRTPGPPAPPPSSHLRFSFTTAVCSGPTMVE